MSIWGKLCEIATNGHPRLHNVNSIQDHSGVVGAIPDNIISFSANRLFKDSGKTTTEIGLNTTHRGGTGSDHSDVAANTAARHTHPVTSGSVANLSTLTLNHAKNNSTPAILAQYIKTDIFQCMTLREALSFHVEVEQTQITSTALEPRTVTYAENRIAACQLSNGNVAFVYCALDTVEKLYLKIINPETGVVVVAEKIIDANLDAIWISLASVDEDDTFIISYYDIDNTQNAFQIWNNDGTISVAETVIDAAGTGGIKIAVFPDGDHFVEIHDGAGSDPYWSIWDATTGANVFTVTRLVIGTVQGLAVAVNTDEIVSLVYGGPAATDQLNIYLFDCSTPASPVNAYVGSAFYVSGLMIFSAAGFINADFDPDNKDILRITHPAETLNDLPTHTVLEMLGTGGSNRSLRQVRQYGMAAEGNVYGGGGAFDPDSKFVMFCNRNDRIDEIFNISVDIANHKGMILAGAGNNFTIGGTGTGGEQFFTPQCIAIGNAGFIIFARRESDEVPYYWIIRASHVKIVITDANNVTLTNYMGETLTFKLAYLG